MAIVTRAGKGSPLTNNEMDTNLLLLQQGSIGKNVIVNGDCSVSQLYGSSLITPVAGQFPIDNCQFSATQASKLQTQQVSNILNSLGAVNALTTSVLASYTPVATDNFVNKIPVEGVNFARFQYGTVNAIAGSLQFKAMASVAGTYSGAIQNYASTRSYPFSFTISAGEIAAGGKLVKVENIPGDTGGTWVGATNAGAAYIVFDLGSGTNYKSTAGTWQAGNFNGVTGSTNLVAQANGSTLTITDVQFEVGAYCTTFERKLFDQNLKECQRYLSMSFPYGTAPAQNAGLSGAFCFFTTGAGAVLSGATLTFPTTMRVASPTMTYYNPQAANAFARNIDATADFTSFATYQQGDKTHFATGTQPVASATSQRCGVHYMADCRI